MTSLATLIDALLEPKFSGMGKNTVISGSIIHETTKYPSKCSYLGTLFSQIIIVQISV